MDYQITEPDGDLEFKIGFLETDIDILKAQIKNKFRILPVLTTSLEHDKASPDITIKSSSTYIEMDALDIKVLNQQLKNQEHDLAELRVRASIKIPIKNNEKGKDKIKKDDS